MAKDVIMPALGMAQETGTLIQWLKRPGDAVVKGEPLMEIETDKTTVEIEAPASGILASVTAQPGDVVPVGQRIALILLPGESAEPVPAVSASVPSNPLLSVGAHGNAPAPTPTRTSVGAQHASPTPASNSAPVSAGSAFVGAQHTSPTPASNSAPVSAGSAFVGAHHASPLPSELPTLEATPVARRVAAEHNLDLAQVKPGGGRVGKDDVLAFVANRQYPADTGRSIRQTPPLSARVLASPKARRLAQESGLDLALMPGSGPDGAVLAADVLAFTPQEMPQPSNLPEPQILAVSRLWQIMAERVTQSWTTVPHFYLLREVNATRLIAWLSEVRARSAAKITYTDLLVKVTAAALRHHPRLNASWLKNTIASNPQVNIGLAVAVEDGLLVPVVHDADTLGLSALAARRIDLVAKAQAGKLAPDDLSGGTFTISNLGMYGVDAFNAIVNPPQAAILAVSRIADRVVPLNGQPAVQPTLTLSLSCDHRVVDGARGAQFLQTLADLIENPIRLLD